LAKWHRGTLGGKLSTGVVGPRDPAERTTLEAPLFDYVVYYQEDRMHDTLGKDTPNLRSVEKKPSSKAKVISSVRLGGLHDRYSWREAA
jgi:hypothetical protein